jgi:hypothetical protein
MHISKTRQHGLCEARRLWNAKDMARQLQQYILLRLIRVFFNAASWVIIYFNLMVPRVRDAIRVPAQLP